MGGQKFAQIARVLGFVHAVLFPRFSCKQVGPPSGPFRRSLSAQLQAD